MKSHPMWPARPGQPLPPLPLAMRPAMLANGRDPDRDRDAAIVAHVALFLSYKRRGDYVAAAEAIRELLRLGVAIKLRVAKGDR